MSPDDGGTGEAEERGLKKKEHLAVPLPAISRCAVRRRGLLKRRARINGSGHCSNGLGKEYDMTRMAVVMKKAQKEITNIIPNTSSTPSDAQKATNKLPQVIIWQMILYILYPRGLGNWRKAMMESMIYEDKSVNAITLSEVTPIL